MLPVGPNAVLVQRAKVVARNFAFAITNIADVGLASLRELEKWINVRSTSVAAKRSISKVICHRRLCYASVNLDLRQASKRLYNDTEVDS